MGALLRSLIVFMSTVLIAPTYAGSREPPEIVASVPHTQGIRCVAFSPDGRQALSGSNDGAVKLWDTATGRLLRTFQGLFSNISNAVFSPDGTRVAAGSMFKDKLMIWETSTGRLLRTFEGGVNNNVLAVAFSPDGKRLAWSTNLGTKIWETASGNSPTTVEAQPGDEKPTTLVFSPDSTRMAAGGDFKIRVWDPSSGRLLQTINHPASALTFTPDSSRLVTAGQHQLKNEISVWDVASAKLLQSSLGHSDRISALALSRDGTRLVTGSWDKTVRLWDFKAQTLLHSMRTHTQTVNSVAFSADDKSILSGGLDGRLILWSAAGEVRTEFTGNAEVFGAVAMTRDGALLVSAGRHAINLRDAATGRTTRTLVDPARAIAISPDDKLIASGSADHSIRLWDVASGRALRTMTGHGDVISSIAFSANGKYIVTGSNDQTIRIWETASGKVVRTIGGHPSYIISVAISPDGKRIASSVGIRTGDFSSLVQIWDLSTGKNVATCPSLVDSVRAIAFSPDGNRLAMGAFVNDPLTICDAKTGRNVHIPNSMKGHTNQVHSLAYSPDGRTLLSGSVDGTLRLWDANSGQALRVMKGHAAAVNSVAFSPDGRRLFSASDDTTVRVWAADTGEALCSFFASGDGEWLAVTPDGFFTGSPNAGRMLSIVRGLDLSAIEQVYQSLFGPDLVREALAGDPAGEVREAARYINLESVLDSGPAPGIALSAPVASNISASGLVDIEANVTDGGKGIGRIEWRVNGITIGVTQGPTSASRTLKVNRTISLDPGNNTIEVVAYERRNVLASLPARTTLNWEGSIAAKPRLYVLAIGINKYVDKGSPVSGNTQSASFPPLGLAVSDAKAIAAAFEKAGAGYYGEIVVRTLVDEQASLSQLDAAVKQMADAIGPRDTFIFYAAAHGYSTNGRFYLIPQDHQGGIAPDALARNAIDQSRLQDWIVNRVQARKVLILLDTCESGALTSGYRRSRLDAASSESAIGRLHEATGRPVLTAAALGQSALELSDLGHGVFTSAIIDSLYRGDMNGDGAVSVSELVAHVQELVPKLIKDPKTRSEIMRRGAIGDLQSARFGGRGEDFVIANRLK